MEREREREREGGRERGRETETETEIERQRENSRVCESFSLFLKFNIFFIGACRSIVVI